MKTYTIYTQNHEIHIKASGYYVKEHPRLDDITIKFYVEKGSKKTIKFFIRQKDVIAILDSDF